MTREEFLRQMIDDYRKKIGTYESMIREWESELGKPQNDQAAAEVTGAMQKKESSGAEPTNLVRDYQFYGKSQPEAAKLFLEIVGHPLRTQTILAGIEKGGVKVGGKTPKDKKTNLYTILYRSDEFGFVAKDTWGLKTWPGVTKEKSKPEVLIDAAQAGMKTTELVDEALKK